MAGLSRPGSLFAAVLVLVGAEHLRADDAPAAAPLRLTLDEAIARGLRASYKLEEAEARYRQSEGAALTRSAEQWPIASVQSGYTRTSHVPETSLTDPSSGESFKLFSDVPDNLRFRADLRWPIFTSGRTQALAHAARSQSAAVKEDRATAEADLKLEITRAFWAVVTGDASVKVLEQALARVDGHLNDTRSRLHVGLVPPNDVYSTEAQRSRQEMLLIQARNLSEAARGDLRQLVGLSADEPVEVDAELTPPEAPAGDAAALVEQARAGRSDRRALDLRLRQAGQEESAARALRWPTLWLQSGYDYARPNPLILPHEAKWSGTWDVGVALNWNLWDSGRTSGAIGQASANRQAVESQMRDFDRTLEKDVRQRRLDVETALAEIAAANQGLRSAREAHRIVSETYAAQLASNTEVLDAHASLLQAELALTRAVAGARLASARLDRVLGR